MGLKKRIVTIAAAVLTLAGCLCSSFTASASDAETGEFFPGALAPTAEELDSLPEIEVDASAYESLPSKFDITDSQYAKYFPEIGNQGDIPSCAAWASTYYQFTYEVNKLRGVATDESNTYSPAFTYNYLCGNDLNGSFVTSAYRILANQGAMKLADFPYCSKSSEYNFDWCNDKDKLIEALEYRVSNSYIKKVRYSTSPEFKQVKSLIASGKPAIAMTQYDGWVYDSSGECVVSCKYDLGLHYVTIVGYDDNYTTPDGKIKGALKVANSFGKNWDHGKDGYVWIAYEAMNPEDFTDGTAPVFFMNIGEVETKNVFYFMDVKKYNVNFANVVTFSSREPCRTSLQVQELNKKDDKFSGLTSSVTPYSSAKTCCIAYDLFDNQGTCSMDDYLSKRLHLNFANTSQYGASNITNVVYDNLGKTVIPQEFVPGSLDSNGQYINSVLIKLAKGRVSAYDNKPITDADVKMVQDYLLGSIEFSNLQKYLADYDNNGVVNLADVVNMNVAVASAKGEEYYITDYIDSLGCSIADLIEQEYGVSIEEYVAENYEELSSLNVIPPEMRSDLYA